jgi:hypothetical protein
MNNALNIAIADSWTQDKQSPWLYEKAGITLDEHGIIEKYSNFNGLMPIVCQINDAINLYQMVISSSRIDVTYDGEYVTGGVYKGVDGIINLLQQMILKYYELTGE